MPLSEILSWGGGSIVVLLTFIQIAPIQVNPWSAIAGALGKAINRDVMRELQSVQKSLEQTNARLDEQSRIGDERNADSQRERILRFNVELMRDEYHTREDFIEILTVIDGYEKYCKAHPEYSNSRAVHAVANINRVYDERLEKNDFYKAGSQ